MNVSKLFYCAAAHLCKIIDSNFSTLQMEIKEAGEEGLFITSLGEIHINEWKNFYRVLFEESSAVVAQLRMFMLVHIHNSISSNTSQQLSNL